MRHRKSGRKLGRDTKHRRALYRNLVTSLLEHERIETTEAKAKEVRGITDGMIRLGKKGDLASRRRAAAFLMSRSIVGKLFSDLGDRFRERPGGYTRLIKTRIRKGDGARMAVIELVVQGEQKMGSETGIKEEARGTKKA